MKNLLRLLVLALPILCMAQSAAVIQQWNGRPAIGVFQITPLPTITWTPTITPTPQNTPSGTSPTWTATATATSTSTLTPIPTATPSVHQKFSSAPITITSAASQFYALSNIGFNPSALCVSMGALSATCPTTTIGIFGSLANNNGNGTASQISAGITTTISTGTTNSYMLCQSNQSGAGLVCNAGAYPFNYVFLDLTGLGASATLVIQWIFTN